MDPQVLLEDNTRPSGHTATGSVYGTGWEFTISATDSAQVLTLVIGIGRRLPPRGSEKITLGYGTLTVEDSS